MRTVQEIFDFLCRLAPLELQTDFDNAGFLLGRAGAPVDRALLALDITPEVIQEAGEKQVQLIVSHHPLIFGGGLKAVTDTSGAEKLLRLAELGIAVVSMHTNLDIAQGGVNDVLIELLGAKAEDSLDAYGCGRIGTLEEPMPFDCFLARCRERLQTKGLRYVDAGREVRRLAVMGGSGVSSISSR